MTAKLLALILGLSICAQSALAYQVFDDPTMSTHPYIADSVSRTVSFNSPATGAYSCPTGAAYFFVNITAGSTLLIQLGVQTQDPATGAWYDVITEANLTGVISASYVYGAGTSTGATASHTIRFPAVFRIRMYHGNANAATYTVGGYCY